MFCILELVLRGGILKWFMVISWQVNDSLLFKAYISAKKHVKLIQKDKNAMFHPTGSGQKIVSF